MKSNIESGCGRLVTGGVLGMLAAASSADGGHSVPAGISAQQHLHLFEQIVVSPGWMLAVGVAVVALAALAVKRVRAKGH